MLSFVNTGLERIGSSCVTEKRSQGGTEESSWHGPAPSLAAEPLGVRLAILQEASL